MRVAIPLFGHTVAPRFLYADTFLIVDIKDGRVIREVNQKAGVPSRTDRVDRLDRLGVEVILCLEFDQPLIRDAQRRDIHVYAGVSGDAHRVIEMLTQKKEEAAQADLQSALHR